jgi:hypothetical protein
MSDVKISGLPSSTGVDPASDFIPIVHNGTTQKITPNELFNANTILLPIYADNATAVTGGLTIGYLYKTATGEVRIVV